jgi:hypothetical protein
LRSCCARWSSSHQPTSRRCRRAASSRACGNGSTCWRSGRNRPSFVHLERKYQKVNADFQKEWIRPAPAEQVEKRFDQFVERSEMIYGKLEEPQRAVVRAQLQQSAFDAKRVLAERQRRQRDLLQTLRKLAGQPVGIAEARSLMRAYLDRVREPPDAAARQYVQSLIDEGCRSFSALHNSMGAAQREVAIRRLRAYQRDLQELAAQK